MTSLTIFIIIMTISMGAILGVFDANRRSQSESVVMNNLNLAVESMAREMRFGINYHCGSSGDITVPQNCAQGNTFISFLTSDGVQMVYRLNGNSIERSTDGGLSYLAVTAPEIVVENLTFYVLGGGAPPANLNQPKTLITLKGHAGDKVGTQTVFSLQTLVSQRRLDNGQ
ncbi:MAG: seg [Parcubacteria group bacterium]|nr:seg [Parcubacteria group bacterium]